MTVTDTTFGNDPVAAPAFARLLVTELQRLFARRFTRILLALAVVGYLVAVGFLWQRYAQPTAADLAQATSARAQMVTEIEQSLKSCQAQNPANADQVCGSAPTADQLPLEQFLPRPAFPPTDVPHLAFAVGLAVALAGFLLAATFIGAEWSSRNIVTWLYYEPRRLRMMGAKLLAVLGVQLALAVLAQVIWWATARALIAYRGSPVSGLGEQAATFWSDVAGVQVRAALLVIPVALLGFSLANLLRNSAAAMGIGFVYLAVLESVLRSVTPAVQPYLLTDSALAWVTTGGIDVLGKMVYDQHEGGFVPATIHISNAHGGVVLCVYALVALVVSMLVFRRRDIA